MESFLASVLSFSGDKPIGVHARLGHAGRVLASRLRVAALARARAIAETQVRDAAERARDLPGMISWALVVRGAGWRRPDGTPEYLVSDGRDAEAWLVQEAATRLQVDPEDVRRVGGLGFGVRGLPQETVDAARPTLEAMRQLERDDPGYRDWLAGKLRELYPGAAAFLPAWARENGRRGAEGVDRAPVHGMRRRSRAEKLAHALTLLKGHPDWTNERIARAVGVVPGTVSKWPEFRRAREGIAEGGKQRLESRSNPKSRRIEAVGDTDETA